ncbi:MAG: ATP-binding protein, partial [Verrucomicrobiae bacterium]|nr:ATP-binding protein [Verrucomicrobiae bacterium]
MIARLLRHKSIEEQLVFLGAVTCSAGLTVAACIFLANRWVDLRREATSEVRDRLELVSSFLAAALDSGDTAAATNILLALKSNPQTAHITGYVADGGLIGTLSGSAFSQGTAGLRDYEVHIQGRMVSLYRPVVQQGRQRVAVIFLQTKAEPAYGRLLLPVLGTVATCGLSLLVGVAASRRIRHSISEPLRKLCHSAKLALSDGTQNLSFSTNGSENELSSLAERFDKILASIQSREAAVIRSEGELEKRVAERTRELQEEIQQRSRMEAALADEKERLAITLRSIGDGVIATDCRGDIVLMNAAAEELTGWSCGEAIGRNLRHVFRCLYMETRQPITNLVEDALRTGASTRLTEGIVLIAKNQAERLIELNCAPISDPGGRNVGVVLVFRDITEHQRHVEALLAASKLQSIGVMAGGIAHDFNNILTSIIGHISMAKRSPEANGEVLGHLISAEESAMKAREITRQLLTFAKCGVPVKRTMRVNNLISEATEFALRGSNVKSRIIIDDSLWPVDVDDGQFSQVIQNIVLRGVRAMASGGTIEVRATNVTLAEGSVIPLPRGSYILISIQDHGQPIKAEDIPHVFDPYFIKEGGGLGLAAAYTIVKRHGGHIAVDPRPDQGTTFHIYFPAKPAQVPPEPSQSKGQQVKRILLVDDDEQIRKVATAMLQSVGYEVTAVDEGGAAVQKFCEARSAGRPFDAVILDLTVQGGKGGRETIQELLLIDDKVKAIVSS